jgi:hypothetical protein
MKKSVEVSLKINKLIHEKCDNVPHNIGLEVYHIFKEEFIEKSNDKLNEFTDLHISRVTSSLQDKPIKRKKEAANAKFHFQEGMRAVLSFINDR